MDGELVGRRVAIACEGGGSHTAFTAGALKRLLREPIEIVALSGTSGGAVCATLAWRGLLAGDRDDAVRRLEAFWADNASEGLEALWETWVRLGARLVGEVVSPELSPYNYAWDARGALRELLERSQSFLEDLQRHGWRQASDFLREPDLHLEPEGARPRPARRSAGGDGQRRTSRGRARERR